jgi:hypothetical protein
MWFSINMLLTLAFLAPDLVKGIVDDRTPRGIGLNQPKRPIRSSGS